jgi:hypothetical protein
MLREMMRYHIRAIPEPGEQKAQARALLTFLQRAWPAKDDPRAWVGKEAELVLAREKDNIFHDELNEDYIPSTSTSSWTTRDATTCSTSGRATTTR